MNYKQKIKLIKQQHLTGKYDAVLITQLHNIRYLCGFSGSNGVLLITKDKNVFFTDFRYKEQSAAQIKDVAEIEVIERKLLDNVAKYINKLGCKDILIEDTTAVSTFEDYKAALSGSLYSGTRVVEGLRETKDKQEIKDLQKAFDIADKAFEQLLGVIKAGMRETEIAAHLEFFMKMLGSEGESFKTIVASGVNASSPHAEVTTKKLQKGEMLKIDFGATYKGYHSDMTRTLFCGRADEKFKNIYDIVLTAQKKAMKALKVGAVCSSVDKTARKYIEAKGFGEFFGHGLGHSVGLEIHEMPILSPTCKKKVEEGNVLTIEPGIYLPGWGGIRIEDVFAVNKTGLTRLTNTPNELKEIDC